MNNHRNPQASVSKQAPSDNFNPSDRTALIELLKHAASAARILVHLDGAIAAGPLGEPRTLAGPDGTASDDRVAYDEVPMLASSAGGAQ
jgi:hypothetical protein